MTEEKRSKRMFVVVGIIVWLAAAGMWFYETAGISSRFHDGASLQGLINAVIVAGIATIVLVLLWYFPFFKQVPPHLAAMNEETKPKASNDGFQNVVLGLRGRLDPKKDYKAFVFLDFDNASMIFQQLMKEGFSSYIIECGDDPVMVAIAVEIDSEKDEVRFDGVIGTLDGDDGLIDLGLNNPNGYFR